MRWIEVTVNCTGDPDLMCADLAELGVGGMIVEDEQDFENFLENNQVNLTLRNNGFKEINYRAGNTFNIRRRDCINPNCSWSCIANLLLVPFQ